MLNGDDEFILLENSRKDVTVLQRYLNIQLDQVRSSTVKKKTLKRGTL